MRRHSGRCRCHAGRTGLESTGRRQSGESSARNPHGSAPPRPGCCLRGRRPCLLAPVPNARRWQSQRPETAPGACAVRSYGWDPRSRPHFPKPSVMGSRKRAQVKPSAQMCEQMRPCPASRSSLRGGATYHGSRQSACPHDRHEGRLPRALAFAPRPPGRATRRHCQRVRWCRRPPSWWQRRSSKTQDRCASGWPCVIVRECRGLAKACVCHRLSAFGGFAHTRTCSPARLPSGARPCWPCEGTAQGQETASQRRGSPPKGRLAALCEGRDRGWSLRH